MTAAESCTDEMRSSSEVPVSGVETRPVQSRMRESAVALHVNAPLLARISDTASVTGMPARNPRKLRGGRAWMCGAEIGGGLAMIMRSESNKKRTAGAVKGTLPSAPAVHVLSIRPS